MYIHCIHIYMYKIRLEFVYNNDCASIYFLTNENFINIILKIKQFLYFFMEKKK